MKRSRYRSLKPLILPRQMSRPMDWDRDFETAAPIDVEIGFGNGEYLCRRAREKTDHSMLGIEFKWGCVARTLRRLSLEHISNVRLVHGDVRLVFERLVPPKRLSYVFSLFPYPWPKNHHEKHRLFTRSFLALVNSRLVEDGLFRIVTDHKEFHDWILERTDHTGFAVHTCIILPQYHTKYERKWLSQGQKHFYEMNMRKKEHRSIALKEDFPLQTFKLGAFDPEKFHIGNTRGEITICFKDFIFDSAQKKGMLRVAVAEEGLTQHFWIKIVFAKKNWVIKADSSSGIVPTEGVQRAVSYVYEAAQKTVSVAAPRSMTV